MRTTTATLSLSMGKAVMIIPVKVAYMRGSGGDLNEGEITTYNPEMHTF